MVELASTFCGVYAFLTLLKVSQFLLSLVPTKAATNSMEYAPSLKALMLFQDYVFLPQHEETISKIPRKIFRVITDSWVMDYTNLVHKRKGGPLRVFKSRKDATSTFFKEFCKETSDFMVHWVSHSNVAFIGQPLGLHCMFALLLYVTVAPFLLLREVCLGGDGISFICKIAAALTISEVYVVSCKESLPLETALTKYPWVAGIFSKQQIHPMIGRAVCPLYKRELPFPVKEDVMDFDYDAILSGIVSLRQRHDSFWGNLREALYASHYALAGLVIYLCYLELFQGESVLLSLVSTVAPYAAVFYTVRVLVDWNLGIKWHPSLYYFM